MNSRLLFLDGIRGWGALVVLFYHTYVLLLPLEPTHQDGNHLFFLNGPFAVWIFFLVSGMALSIGFYEDGKSEGLKRSLLVGRYIRLALPIFVLSACIFIAGQFGLIPRFGQPPRPGLETQFLASVDLAKVFSFSFVEVFFDYWKSYTLAGPLWTIQYELWGSFLVFTILLGLKELARSLRFLAMLSLVLAVFTHYYAAFTIGMIISLLYSQSWHLKYEKEIKTAFAILVIPLLLVSFYLPEHNLYLVTASAFTFFFVFQKQLRLFFSNGLSRYLGKISFGLYLVHAPLLLVLGSHMHSRQWAPAYVNASLVLACLAAAHLFQYVDRFARDFSRKSAAFIFNFLTRAT